MVKISPRRVELMASLLEQHVTDLIYQKYQQTEFIKRFGKDDLGRTPVLKIIHQIENEIAEAENFREELDELNFQVEMEEPTKIPVRTSRKRKQKTEAVSA